MTKNQSGCRREEKVSVPTSNQMPIPWSARSYPSHYADSAIPAVRKSGQWCCKCKETHETDITLSDNSLRSMSFAFMSYAIKCGCINRTTLQDLYMLSNSPIVLNETRLNIKSNKLSRSMILSWETFSNHKKLYSMHIGITTSKQA